MDILGALKVTVKRGINLIICDALSASDPYVIISSGSQKLKTRVIQDNCNPEWNDVLTLSVSNPDMIIKLTVFDKDTFTKHDEMGDAIIDIKPYLECMKMGLEEFPKGTIVKKVDPNAHNCLAYESNIICAGKGKLVQDMTLRLQNVEKGKVQLQIEWLDLPGCRGICF